MLLGVRNDAEKGCQTGTMAKLPQLKILRTRPGNMELKLEDQAFLKESCMNLARLSTSNVVSFASMSEMGYKRGRPIEGRPQPHRTDSPRRKTALNCYNDRRQSMDKNIDIQAVSLPAVSLLHRTTES